MVNSLIRGGLADKTTSKYVGAARDYAEWATQSGGANPNGTIPSPTELDLVFFVGSLALRGLAPGTIEGKISGICWWFEMSGFPNPGRGTNGRTKRRLARAMRGVRRTMSRPKKIRKGVTTDILKGMVGALRVAAPELDDDDAAAYAAALSHAVYGLLRAGEFVAKEVQKMDPERDARGRDVELESRADGAEPTWYRSTIRAAKTDVFRRTSTHRINATGTSDCPVRRMADWLDVRRAGPDEPLFRLNSGRNMTRADLSRVMRLTLDYIGLNPAEFAPHSLRKGGAISLSAAGYGPETICLLGRWRSESWLDYQDLSADLQAAAHRRMAGVLPGAITLKDRQVFENRFDEVLQH